MSESSTRVGKIARLPATVRDEVCRRLHDGQSASQIIPWLHGKSEVLKVLDTHFGEEPISPQNLSEWRGGGYQDWLKRRAEVENLKSLSSYAFELAQAGGSVTEGAAAIAGGKILEFLETAEDDKVEGLARALASLRTSEATAIRARTAEARLSQQGRAIALEEKKFQRETAKLFVKWAATPEAQEILGSRDSEKVQMEKLVQLMFGEKPE